MKDDKGEEKKLDIFQTKCLRRIFHIKWQQHLPNKEVLEMAGADPISDEVRRRRWCWIGHVLRKEANSDCAVALGWKPEGKRSRGRPTLVSHCREGQRQTRMEHMGKSEVGSKQRQQWREDTCLGHACLLAQGELTTYIIFLFFYITIYMCISIVIYFLTLGLYILYTL